LQESERKLKSAVYLCICQTGKKISSSPIYTPMIFVNVNKRRQLSQKSMRRESESEETNKIELIRIELFYKKS